LFKECKKQIFGIRWNPSDNSEFVSVGDQHLYFWTVSENAKKSSASASSKSKSAAVDVTMWPCKTGNDLGFVAVAYNQSGTVFTAGSDG